MDRERYIEIDRSGKGLTPDEHKKGWHFCYDWDEMLIGPGMREFEECCVHREDILAHKWDD